MNILHVVGARPNFMKAAPVLHALGRYPHVRQVLVHTGQHYDIKMSDVFFQELSMPPPDVNLGVGSGSHGRQTADIMTRFEPIVLEENPELVLVYGDVNSTMAAALICAKLRVAVGHVEAGLRSGDRGMPEEINRLVTDQLADLLFTPSQDGNDNLMREGVAREKIHLVGNVMIDTLLHLLPRAAERWPALRSILELESIEEEGRPFALVTLHRPSNVDDPEGLRKIMQVLQELSRHIPVIFPVHPRTRQRLKDLDLGHGNGRLRTIAPLGYIGFLALQAHAALVITDSGGVQEETTFLRIPCLTLRDNTERPVTITMGTNTLLGRNTERLRHEVLRILEDGGKRGTVPPLWDGKAGKRIAQIVVRRLSRPHVEEPAAELLVV